jgi:hypothetical protein
MSARNAETARVTTIVAVEPPEAFRVFTEETDAWWRHGVRFRGHPKHRVRHELQGSAFAAMLGLWWGDLATTYRLRAVEGRETRAR